VGEASSRENYAESVVTRVAEAAGDAAVEFKDAVDGFGAAVWNAASIWRAILLPSRKLFVA
jgi:hypothetical protein